MTPLVADILAVQRLYRVAVVEGGATIWGRGSTATGALAVLFGQIFGTATADPLAYAGNAVTFTILDTGGADLLDLGLDARNQRIDLNPEGISDVQGLTGNLIIARGTLIENCIAGSGDDWVNGNRAGNGLWGGAGAERLAGGGGADIFVWQSVAQALADHIRDFTPGSDRFALSAIDLDDVTPGHQGFHVIDQAVFGQRVGKLRFAVDPATGLTRIEGDGEGDVDGDGVAEVALYLTAVFALLASDFLL